MTRPVISNDQDWLDLKMNQEGLVKGFVEYVAHDGLTISFTDWSRLFIDCGHHEIEMMDLLEEEIELPVVRTEDGLYADALAITEALGRIGMKAGA